MQTGKDDMILNGKKQTGENHVVCVMNIEFVCCEHVVTVWFRMCHQNKGEFESKYSSPHQALLILSQLIEIFAHMWCRKNK